MILKAISKYLTKRDIEHNIPNSPLRTHNIIIEHDHYYYNICENPDNTITINNYNWTNTQASLITEITTIHSADPELFPKILKAIKQDHR
jgi:hypothetical protein